MLDKLRKIGSILLIGVLLTPSIIKFEHHHDEFFCKASHHEKHFHPYHPKCWVCAFEFSLFSLTGKTLLPPKPTFPRALNDRNQQFKPFFPSDYSFLLRAPPIVCA